MAAKLGYRNVSVFQDGLPGWVAAGYPTRTIEKLPKASIDTVSTTNLLRMLEAEGDILLLDIRFGRLAREYRISAANQINIPLDMLIKRHTELPRGRKIVIIDEIGNRGPVAGRYLKAKGYENLVAMEGGMQRWKKDGYPVSQ